MKAIQNQETKQLIYGSLCTLIVIAVMIFFSEITGEKEIIFPEIAALCMGNFLIPKLIWKANYLKTLIYISLCAVLGVLIVLYIPIPIWAQIAFAFAVGQLIFFFSGTSVAPMLSAITLPVLLQTSSYVYVISAIGLTALVIFFSILLEKGNIRPKYDGQKASLPRKEFVATFTFRTLLTLLLAFLCTFFNWRIKFTIAPPLLVAFFELTTNKASPPAKRPVATIILFTLCAILGSACRYIFTILIGIPLTISSVIAMIGVILLMKRIMKLPFLPAAAMCILAMLIPEEIVLYYPVEVAVGITVLTYSALFWRKIIWREKKGEGEKPKEAKEITIVIENSNNNNNNNNNNSEKEENKQISKEDRTKDNNIEDNKNNNKNVNEE